MAVQLGEQKALVDLINVLKSLMGRNEEEEARLFSVVPTDKTKVNGHKLKIK